MADAALSLVLLAGLATHGWTLSSMCGVSTHRHVLDLRSDKSENFFEPIPMGAISPNSASRHSYGAKIPNLINEHL